MVDEVINATRFGGAEVIKRKGGTFYAVAPMIAELIKAIKDDTHQVLPVSTLLNGEFLDMHNVALSLPCVIGKAGPRQARAAAAVGGREGRPAQVVQRLARSAGIGRALDSPGVERDAAATVHSAKASFDPSTPFFRLLVDEDGLTDALLEFVTRSARLRATTCPVIQDLHDLAPGMVPCSRRWCSDGVEERERRGRVRPRRAVRRRPPRRRLNQREPTGGFEPSTAALQSSCSGH